MPCWVVAPSRRFCTPYEAAKPIRHCDGREGERPGDCAPRAAGRRGVGSTEGICTIYFIGRFHVGAVLAGVSLQLRDDLQSNKRCVLSLRRPQCTTDDPPSRVPTSLRTPF